jgi:16S rRNA processing protein RimM
MNFKEYIQIGHTGKPHGIHGAIKLVVKERYEQDALQANILFIDVKGGLVPFFVEDLSIGNAWIIKFEDVETPEQAAALSAKGVYLRESDLLPPEQDDDAEPDYNRFIDYEVVDTEVGPIGRIREVYDLGAQSLAGVVANNREILIPMHKDLIKAIHEDVKEIVMALPKGLLEL